MYFNLSFTDVLIAGLIYFSTLFSVCFTLHSFDPIMSRKLLLFIE